MNLFKLCFHVPESHLETVKDAVFSAGAGHTGGNYDRCSFQVRGEGQFRALEGSTPFVGRKGEVERVIEYRVETLCRGREVLDRALAALRQAHPYEEPAIDVWQLEET